MIMHRHSYIANGTDDPLRLGDLPDARRRYADFIGPADRVHSGIVTRIFVSRSYSGLARPIGCFAERLGPWK